MLKIIEGSLPKLKEEMKTHKGLRDIQIRQFKKGNKEKLKKSNSHAVKQLQELQKDADMCMQSKRLPLKVEHLIIDFKLYERFIKSLKKMSYSVSVEKQKLIVDYHSTAKTSGKLELYDISKYYTSFSHIPKAVITNVND